MLRRLIIIAPSTVMDNTTVLRPFYMKEVWDLLWVVPENKLGPMNGSGRKACYVASM